MNIRRRDKARKDPPTEIALLHEDVRLLKQEIGILKQRGPTSIYAINKGTYIDPIQGEIAINHPGSHPIASPTSGIVYRHEDQWREVSGNIPVWAVLSTTDSGWEYQGAGADDNIDWYQLWLSNNSSGVFSFEVVSAGGQFGDDIVFLNALQSGLYTFTWQFLTSDLEAIITAPAAFSYQIRLNMMGGVPGTNFGSNPNAFPGWIHPTAVLQDRKQLWISLTSADDLYLPTSFTLPIRHPNPGTLRRMGEMRMFHNPSGSGVFWTVRLWVIRWADFNWNQALDFSPANATWPP